MSGSYLQLSTAKMKARADGETVDPRGWTGKNGSSRCRVCEVPWAGPGRLIPGRLQELAQLHPQPFGGSAVGLGLSQGVQGNRQPVCRQMQSCDWPSDASRDRSSFLRVHFLSLTTGRITAPHHHLYIQIDHRYVYLVPWAEPGFTTDANMCVLRHHSPPRPYCTLRLHKIKILLQFPLSQMKH